MSTYLITGSNRGIGLELCRQIHKRGDNIIATCREASKELRDLGVRIEENIDITKAKLLRWHAKTYPSYAYLKNQYVLKGHLLILQD